MYLSIYTHIYHWLIYEQHKENLESLESIHELVEAGFQNDKPLHTLDALSHPSVFKIISHNEFNELPHSEVQDILRRHHIIVTKRPSSELTFRTALTHLAPLNRATEIQGHITF